MALQTISHKGIVTSISDNALLVEIPVQTACDGCHASKACSMGKDTRQIKVDNFSGSYTIGQPVVLTIRQNLGRWAVVLAYVVPLLVLFPALLAGQRMFGNENLAALTAFGAVALYYLLLFLFRSRISRAITIAIQDTDDNG